MPSPNSAASLGVFVYADWTLLGVGRHRNSMTDYDLKRLPPPPLCLRLLVFRNHAMPTWTALGTVAVNLCLAGADLPRLVGVDSPI